jgi:hypothetical protein
MLCFPAMNNISKLDSACRSIFPCRVGCFKQLQQVGREWGNFGLPGTSLLNLAARYKTRAHFSCMVHVMKEADVPVLDSYWLTLTKKAGSPRSCLQFNWKASSTLGPQFTFVGATVVTTFLA